MKRRILSFVLALSLAVGFLPAVAYAATPADAPIKLGSNTYKLSAYDKPVYTVNYSKETQDTAGNSFAKWGQTSSGANESNYNAKYEWKSGDPGPTLTLRDFRIDEWNNATGKMEAKISSGEYTTTGLSTTAITADADAPLTIVVEENSLIETKYGITFKNDTTIIGENNATLTINNQSSCIASNNTAGAELTINANLDLTLRTYHNAAYGGAVMHTYQADLTINGGNISCKIENTEATSVSAIAVRSSGNLTINGGNITAVSINSVNATNGSISAAGKLIVHDGAVTANSARGVSIYGKTGVEINGGSVKAVAPALYGFNAGTDDAPADIAITGGTVEIAGKSAFGKIPVLGAGIGGFAGTCEKDADYFDETKFRSAWVKLSAASSQPTVPDTPTGAVAVKPYYAIGSSDFNRVKFPNLEGRLTVSVVVENSEVYLSASGVGRDINRIASHIKTVLDRYPEGMRAFVLHNVSSVFQLQEDTIYFEEGVEKLRAVFVDFIKAYAQIGGKLDGIVLDVEYVDTYAWYLYSLAYTKGNPDVYANIVANPRYETDIRPMLVERGFKFYEDASKPEIWSVYPRLKGTETEEYAISQTVWNTIMRIRLNNYMTEAIYEPLAQYMPGVPVYDYQSRATAAWLKDLSDKGVHSYVAGNSVPVGVTSHHNTYGSRLSSEFFAVDGQPIYNTPVAYNGAEFASTPFHHVLWDVNLMKNMYEASGGNVAITVAEYDYSPNKVGTPSNTAFYTESIFHIGLLDPDPFCIYMYDQEFTPEEYDARAQVLQEIMEELTRVAGYTDREPIPVPATWNSSFILSGIYANGRNLWRLTPDTTQVSWESFKLTGDDPTFSVNGQTVTFPQGKIIADGAISVVGTCGYWIETPKNVTPIITNVADRYSQYPAFGEDFEGYEAGTAFTSADALPATCWQVYGTNPVVQSTDSGKVLALTDTAALDNVNLPQNITAGDNYAKQQAWEVSVTLSEAMISGSAQLLMTPADGGFTLEDGRVYYSGNNSHRELSGVTLVAGVKYTFKREINFDTLTCTYCVYAGDVLLGQAADIPIKPVTLPVNTISFSCFDLTNKLLLDDYKLYATGLTADLEVYNGDSGIRLDADAQNSEEKIAYRLSWMNATGAAAKGHLRVARYDNNGCLVSDTLLHTIDMAPGTDGIETDVLNNTTGRLTVYLHVCKKTNTERKNQQDAACGVDGYTGDLVCKECGEIYEKGEVIAASPHKEVMLYGKAATCTEPGLTEGKMCDLCGKVLVEQTQIDPLEHEWIIIEGKEPTCTEPGLTEWEKCQVCGEISIEQETIDALDHSFDNDNDAVCDNCGFVRQMVDTFAFVNYRVVFSDSDTTHKNFRVEIYEMGDKTVTDPSDEKALKAIDSAPVTHWGAGNINKILITDAGNYVLLLKYNVGTAAATKVPLQISVSADPKLIIDKNNKLTVIDDNGANINHRVVVYYLGDQTVEDIYDEAALKTIDATPETVWQKSRINKLALTKGGNYVLHLCYNVGTGAKQTVAQKFTVESIPTLSVNQNNMLIAAEENAENKNHRMTVFYLGDKTVEDIYNETTVAAAAASSKTYWGLSAISKFEAKEGGNYIFHLYYNVGTSAKRTLAIEATLTERPKLSVSADNKLVVEYSDASITNPRAYIYNVGDKAVDNIYDEAALQKIATPTQVWGLSGILKKQLTSGTYVVHLHYNVAGGYKSTVALKITI